MTDIIFLSQWHILCTSKKSHFITIDLSVDLHTTYYCLIQFTSPLFVGWFNNLFSSNKITRNVQKHILYMDIATKWPIIFKQMWCAIVVQLLRASKLFLCSVSITKRRERDLLSRPCATWKGTGLPHFYLVMVV